MGRSRHENASRGRVGQVFYYQHHGGWWLYYREHGRPIRRRVADSRETAVQLAAQVNAQLAVAAPTMFSFTPLPIAELTATIPGLSRARATLVAGHGFPLPFCYAAPRELCAFAQSE